MPPVRRLRAEMAWGDMLRIVNGPLPRERQWTQSRLLRAVNAYVREGFLPETVLDRAGRRETDDRLPASSAPSRAPIRTSRFWRSATGWKRCVSARPLDGQTGSRHQ